MQPWATPETTIVLTDLLHSQPQQLRNGVYVKPEPRYVSSRSGFVELPPLLPPRTPTLPAITDVLRTTSPEQQRYQYENQVNTATTKLPRSASTARTCYGLPATQYSANTLTYPAKFISIVDRPKNTDYNTRNSPMLPYLPTTSIQSANTSGGMTPPGLVSTRTHPIGTPSPRVAARPANRTCRFTGCSHYVVDHGLCVRHGGGKRCTAEGCSSRAKHFGRCWKHGGSLECKAHGCSNRAKSRGYCWSHGGGTKCKVACDKIAISNGLCWAHGGGKRCIVPGCRKQAYERTCNYCNSHFQQYQQAALELAKKQPPLK
ncbi:WRKY transcription factor 19 [Phytophthora nicotianae]|uniref:WRKY transcription factor 19 n=1 Tax=Phytophthora nicotianae TaxID=4792 RepID=A0A0W8CNV7_PHYNI|nr:WRKY transcription factor 19 [Phytophthora nicotianae]